jgi:hypothetical protein
MIRNTFFALVGMLAAVSAQAAVTVSTTSSATVGMAGFTTYTLTATSDTAPIAGFDFFGTEQAPLGFTGAMGQVSQPPTLSQTVFNDSNGFFPLLGRDVSQDSQFKFNATGANSVLVPTGFALEGPDFLKASFALPAPVQSVAFAQIVVADAASATVQYNGLVGFPTSAGLPLASISGCIGLQCGGGDVAPVVADVAGQTNALGDVIMLMPMDSAPGTAPVTFSALTGPTYTKGFGAPDHAFGLGNATWSWDPATQKFQFNTLGSTRGTYVWTGEASGPGGSDPFSITVDVRHVPEPATLSLLGLALVGFVGFARKRS